MKYVLRTEEEWKDIRKKYITASEVATILGLNAYMSPNKLKQEKIQQDFVGNSYTKVGQLLEPVVVQITNYVLNSKFKLYEEDGAKSFFTKGCLGATPDAVQGGNILLECKTTRPTNYLKYSIFPPLNYLLQLQCQLYCTDFVEGYLAILSTDLTQSTSELIWPISIYKVKKLDSLCNLMNEEAERFLSTESFRVKSPLKKKAEVLLGMSHEKVY